MQCYMQSSELFKNFQHLKVLEQFTALHITEESNETDIAALLIAKGANVNAKSEIRLTPLHCSFQNNNLL